MAVFKRCAALALLVVLGMMLGGCGKAAGASDEANRELRIVSLAPSLTETVYALGLGERLVADTVYCVTPEEARALPKVGAWTDVSIEQVLSFHPSHVCLPSTHPCRAQFERLGVTLCAVDGRSMDGILKGILAMGTVFGTPEKARTLVDGMTQRMNVLRETWQKTGTTALHVLIVVGRDYGGNGIRNLTVVGDDAYFRPLMSLVGCDIVPSGVGAAYPLMSREGVLAVQPDVIIEIAPECVGREAEVIADWRNSLPQLKASDRVLVFTENYATVPGLRTVDFLEALAERLLPYRGRVQGEESHE